MIRTITAVSLAAAGAMLAATPLASVAAANTGGVAAAQHQDRIHGTRGDDHLKGTPRHDDISGRRGDDVLRGLAGRDVVNGGFDDDRIYGGAGADSLIPGIGRNVVRGGAGADWANVGNGPDRVYGGAGKDDLWIWDDGQPDTVYCGPGNDKARYSGDAPEADDTFIGCEHIIQIRLS